MSYIKINNKITKNQSGMAAILITMIMMIVISVILLGYLQLASRLQISSLNSNLSSEAYYAAESGVNDALNALQANPNVSKPDCADWNGSGVANPPSNVLNGPPLNNGPLIEYTCLIISPASTNPSFAAYTDQSTTVNIQTATAMNSINFTWSAQPANSPNDFSKCKLSNNFQPDASPPPCYSVLGGVTRASAGVLRLDIVPWQSGESSQTLEAADMTLFLVPVKAAGPCDVAAPCYPSDVVYNPNDSGQVIPVNCTISMNPNTDEGCSINVEFTPNINSNQIYARLLSLYSKNDVQVQAYNSSAGANAANSNALPIINSQAIIDSTGLANNVLQRIQVAVPIQSLGGPSYAIQSTESVCKRFIAIPPDTFSFAAPSAPSGTNYTSCYQN